MPAKMDLGSGLQNTHVHSLATLCCMITPLSTSFSIKPLPSLWPSIGLPPSTQAQVALQSTLTLPTPSTSLTHSRHLILTTQYSCQPHRFESSMELTCTCSLLKENKM